MRILSFLSVNNCQGKEALESSAGLEPRDWRFPYIDYVMYGILPEDTKEAAAIRRKAPKFYYNAITPVSYTHLTLPTIYSV